MNSIEEVSDRLTSLYQENTEWKQIISLGDEALIRALDSSMGDGTSDRDRLLTRAAMDGYDWRGTATGKNGKLLPSVTRFLHHVLSTLDVTMRVNGAWNGEYSYTYLRPVRDSYRKMRSSCHGKGGPLSEYEVRKARTFALESALGLSLYSDDVDYFVKHYNEFEPYLDVIIQRGSMYHRELDMLLETRPQPALANGAL